MKNLVVLTHIGLGDREKPGAPTFWKTMEGFRRSGWKIWIIDAGISPDTPVGERDYGDGIFELRFVPPFLTLSRRRRIGRLFTILKAACITRRLKREAVRLIRAQKMTGTDTVLYAHEIFGVAAAALRRRFGIPTVSRFCGVWDKAACPDTLYNRIRLYPAFQAYATPADLVLMTNDGTWGDRLLQRLKNPGPVAFWRNGVDIPGPAGEGPDCLKSLSPEDEVLVTVSRLWTGKRVDRAVRVLAEAAKTRPRVKLVICGYGPEEGRLRALARELGVEDRVLFTGQVPHRDVFDVFRRGYLFLSLSQESNLGNPLLEAMRCGLPIIATDTEDTGSVVQDGVNGVLISREGISDDAPMEEIILQNTVQAVCRLLDQPKEARRLGQAAQHYAQENFRTWDERIQNEVELVSSMLDKRAAGKMHILVLPSWYPTPDNPINGSFFAEQAEALARYGHRVSVFCRFRDLPRGFRVEKKERAGLTEYEFHHALLPLHLTYFRVVLEMIRVFRREFKGHRPDVIHVHSFGAMRYAWALKRLFGVPVLVTEHATWFQRGLLSPRKLRSVRRAFAAADAVLAVSDGLAEAIQPYCRKPVEVVPNLVKETFFDRGPRPESDRPFRFITVGALVHKKGMDTLLAAFALAAGQEDMTLTVCGDGQDREALERQAKELNIAGRVEFAGQVSREECARRLRESHAFVLASRVETFGVVFVEAMAAGLPVVMTKTSAWKALIREETGIAVEVDDVPALARAMTELARDYGRYDPRRISGFCRENFSEEAVCRRLTEKYQRIRKRR